MAKDDIQKILQTKLALSERAFRTGEPPRLNLAEALRTMHGRFKTPAERQALVGTKAIQCRSYRDDGNLIGLYLVGYVPDDSVGIVPHAKDEELELFPPPENADYLDGELMALIAPDAVIVCRLGLRESALSAYIQYLGPKADLDPEDALFLFKNRTDIDKLKMIQQDGVSQIRFDGVASEAAVNGAAVKAKTFTGKLIDRVMAEVEALTYGERRKAHTSENLKVEVFLKFDGRSGTEVDQAELKDIAESVAEEVDGFTIKTLAGRTITPEDVLLNKRVKVRAYGKSVAFTDVYNEMKAYYAELSKPGGA